MCEGGTLRLLETVLGKWGQGMKEKDGRGESNQDIL
jgi:hypothetical protein